MSKGSEDGEERTVSVGYLNDRMTVVVWTWRGSTRHIISMRKANRREQKDTKTEWIDPDDAPELDNEWFGNANLMIGDKIIRRGRPRGRTKERISLRIDKDVLAKYRDSGPGWQTRMNEALRKAAGL